ncbi:MAG: BON domain-containing protein [Limisphaerales bacterium]
MRGFFSGLILGIILGAVGFWFVQKKAIEHPEAQQRFEQSAAQAGAAASQAAHKMSDALKAKMDTLGLRTDQIKDELARTGKIVRSKTQNIGAETINAASDARAVTEIKAKYVADPDLSAWNISVACHEGHVTLSGTVAAPQDIGKAVALALEAGGVRDVTSTLTVKSK